MSENRETPKNTYDLEIIIKDNDYTNDMTSLNIASSLVSPYPIFEISLSIDPDDSVLEGIFGEDPIKLYLKGIGHDGMIQEEIDVELMLLDTDQMMGSKSMMADDKQKNKTGFSFMAIPIKAFKTITTNINEVFINTTIKEIIQNLVNNNTRAKLQIDEEGINNDIIEQIVIPPTTLYRIIKENGHRGKMDGYLDNQFGLYEGIPAVYCNHENILKVMNITKRIKKGSTLKIYQLTEGEDNNEIYKKSKEGGTLYTSTPVKTSYSGNTKFSSISKNIFHIIKPTTQLFNIIEQDLDDIISKYGTIDRKKKTQKNEELSNRKRYNISHCGNEDSEIFAISDVSSMIGNLASLEMKITGNFLMEELLDIGKVVKFEPSNIEQTDIEGKYILYSTYLRFSRESSEWYKEANLRLVRSNKTN